MKKLAVSCFVLVFLCGVSPAMGGDDFWKKTTREEYDALTEAERVDFVGEKLSSLLGETEKAGISPEDFRNAAEAIAECAWRWPPGYRKNKIASIIESCAVTASFKYPWVPNDGWK